MHVEVIETDFRRKVGESVRLAEEGVGRYRVFTPFLFEDGDHLAIVIRREGNRWILTDEGHTYMHLTYDLDEEVNRKVLARFSDMCEKQFSSLSANRDRIGDYLREAMRI